MILNDGSFVFESLPPGTFALAMTTVNIVAPQQIVLGQGHAMNDLEVQVAQGPKLTVRPFAAETRLPITHAEVMLSLGSDSFPARSFAAGEFVAENLAAGTYQVTVRAENRAEMILDVVVGHADRAVSIDMPMAGRFTGAVNLPDAPTQWTLLVTADSIEDPSRTFTSITYASNSAEAGFDIGNLPAGTYDIRYQVDGYLNHRRLAVAVDTGQHVPLGVVPLVPEGTITGQLLSQHSDFAVGDVNVGAWMDGDLKSVATAQADGSFQLHQLGVGTYVVQAVLPESIEAALSSQTVVDLGLGETVDDVEITVAAGAGHSRNGDGSAYWLGRAWGSGDTAQRGAGTTHVCGFRRRLCVQRSGCRHVSG